MISGVGLFGTLSGLIASHFFGTASHSADSSQEVLKELRELRLRVDEIAENKKEKVWETDSANE
jgi:hypothetical protein